MVAKEHICIGENSKGEDCNSIAKRLADNTKVKFEHGHVKADIACNIAKCQDLKDHCNNMQLFFDLVDEGTKKTVAYVSICGMTYQMRCEEKYSCAISGGRRRRLLARGGSRGC